MARLSLFLLGIALFLGSSAQIEFINGADNDVTSISYSPDGEYIVSGCWDGHVYIYKNDSTPELLFSFEDQISPITSLAFTRDSRHLLVAGQDGAINQYIFHHVDSLEDFIELDTTYAFTKRPVNKVCYGPGMRMIFAADENNRLIAYDSKKRVNRDIKTDAPVLTFAISIDRLNYFVVTKGNPSIIQYNIQGKEVRRFEGHSNDVNDLAVTVDRKYLISASSDKTVRIWNLQKGELAHTFTEHTWNVNSVEVDPYSKYIISCGIDGLINIYSIEDKTLLHSYKSPDGMCTDVSISPDLKTLAVGIQVNNPSKGHGFNLLSSGIERPKTAQELKAEELARIRAEKQKQLEEKIKAKKEAEKTKKPEPKSTKSEPKQKVIKKTEQVEISIDNL